MKQQIYTVTCPDCDEEVFEGEKLEVENWIRLGCKEGYDEWDDYSVTCLCDDCVCLLDK